ncbi:class I SAM-dependent methyltransferase [Paucibacter sp. TC2R-5]|uniref:class I SAM-dependent methyltransferase n=1 Tax=Paucibacter sp. TC2R-5 TaxID=2893555 RepID=UPI0021E389E0|nr:class I SAM-dependent methyltransferase [Paucibacter sp. TC2R-5]MCV2358574.1 class I SAM-dependent methyltransferase [Paucibacter sp. TC2R-5]
MSNTPSPGQECSPNDPHQSDRKGDWWDDFYADRSKKTPPFFGTAPDENLAEWVNSDSALKRGAALDIGCGNGRNAVLLARVGFEVLGVDYSQAAITWATQRASEAGVSLDLRHSSVFDLNIAPATYELVYDSGCFHHLAPQQREAYVQLVWAALKPGGHFGLVCFSPEGGSGLSDQQVLEGKTLGGGLGYTEAALRDLWGPSFRIHSLRQMRTHARDSGLFGQSFLWCMLAQKPVSATA